MTIILHPVRRGCFREALLKQDGMRRPASLCMHTVAREATGTPRSTTTGGRHKRVHARLRDALSSSQAQ